MTSFFGLFGVISSKLSFVFQFCFRGITQLQWVLNIAMSAMVKEERCQTIASDFMYSVMLVYAWKKISWSERTEASYDGVDVLWMQDTEQSRLSFPLWPMYCSTWVIMGKIAVICTVRTNYAKLLGFFVSDNFVTNVFWNIQCTNGILVPRKCLWARTPAPVSAGKMYVMLPGVQMVPNSTP